MVGFLMPFGDDKCGGSDLELLKIPQRERDGRTTTRRPRDPCRRVLFWAFPGIAVLQIECTLQNRPPEGSKSFCLPLLPFVPRKRRRCQRRR